MARRFVTSARVIRAHDFLIHRYGGLPGVHDINLLESALASPRQAHAYGSKDICVQAATLLAAVARNHAFNDGNKRTAFYAMDAFLRRNGYAVNFIPEVWVEVVVGVASGSIKRDDVADFIRRILPARRPPARKRVSR